MAVALTGWAAVSLAGAGQLGAHPGSLCVLGFCALTALRDWKPAPVVVLASIAIALPAFTHNQAAVNGDDALFVSLWLATILYSFTLGTRCSWAVSLAGIAGLAAGINLSSAPFNPIPEMLIAGPWLAGLLVASRRRAAHQLIQRARELDAEREAYAAESVRYERARIARELHDIVAHCVSLMVVQASAGEKLTAIDPHRASESFTSIGEAARQANDEITLLVQLLAESPPARSVDLRIVEELVARAQSSGLSITCELDGDLGGLTEASADAAYRLVQEALTNALKHAPGACVHITLSGPGDQVIVQVVNDPPQAGSSGLERTGGGHGLAGMRERISYCGGTLTAATTPAGGWNVTAAFPCGRGLTRQGAFAPPASRTGGQA
jgi:signal transduction histidine kinase